MDLRMGRLETYDVKVCSRQRRRTRDLRSQMLTDRVTSLLDHAIFGRNLFLNRFHESSHLSLVLQVSIINLNIFDIIARWLIRVRLVFDPLLQISS